MISPETAKFLRALLDTTTLSVGAPDFPQVAALATRARTELDELLAAAVDPHSNGAAEHASA